ncbi:MAG: membrane protein insertion efficiency factor YidD [Helicobacteraceae bacterium]|nr:membrane protein insertion efficiency factor YidD [Helicobacteraceae bacterium]
MRILNRAFAGLIRLYQMTLSPFLGRQCRFYPSCSEYALWSFAQKPFFAALFSTAWRLARCSPLTKGGIDYPLIGKIKPPQYGKKRKIIWFFVPFGKKFIVIKARDGAKGICVGRRFSNKLLSSDK